MKYIYLTVSSRSISRPKIFDTLEEAQEQMRTDFIEVAYLNNRIIRLDYQDEFELENDSENVEENMDAVDENYNEPVEESIDIVNENDIPVDSETPAENIEENAETEEEPVNNIINYSIRDNFGECAITDTEAYVTNTVDNTKWNAQIFTREE